MKRVSVDELIKGRDRLVWSARLWLILGSIVIAILMHVALWLNG